MIDDKRFKKLRSLKDIKLEKAKLRYEMLVAENNMIDNLDHARGFFSFGKVVSQINRGLNTFVKTYSIITGIFRIRKKSGKQKQVEE